MSMSWDQVEQGNKWSRWLTTQLSTPDAVAFKRHLPALVEHEWLQGHADLLDMSNVMFDSQLGLVALYPDFSFEGEDPELLTPAYVVAKLCLTHNINPSSPNLLQWWLSDPDLLLQLLLLKPKQWNELGLHVDDIPADVMDIMANDDRLKDDLFYPWKGVLPFLPKVETDTQMCARIEKSVVLDTLRDYQVEKGMTSAVSAKHFFLEVASFRLLKTFELEILIDNKLDLHSLPIPLNRVTSAELYWLSSKEFSTTLELYQCGLIALNALMIMALKNPSIKLDVFDRIDHEDTHAAVLRVLEMAPERIEKASGDQKRIKLRDDLGL